MHSLFSLSPRVLRFNTALFPLLFLLFLLLHNPRLLSPRDSPSTPPLLSLVILLLFLYLRHPFFSNFHCTPHSFVPPQLLPFLPCLLLLILLFYFTFSLFSDTPLSPSTSFSLHPFLFLLFCPSLHLSPHVPSLPPTLFTPPHSLSHSSSSSLTPSTLSSLCFSSHHPSPLYYCSMIANVLFYVDPSMGILF